MSDTLIEDVRAWQAFDSRGCPTVACRVQLSGGGAGRAIVPSGASTGSHEARELRDGDAPFAGRGVSRAVANVNGWLKKAVAGLEATEQEDIDHALEAADGTTGLDVLGANAILAVSLASMQAVTDQTRVPLWERLNREGSVLLPLPMVNVLSGGAHAGAIVDLQDVLAIPIGARSFAQAIEWIWRVRTATAALVAAHGGHPSLVADEGGLAAEVTTNEAALELVTAGIREAGFQPGEQIALGVDFAANQLAADGSYLLRLEGRRLSGAQWIEQLAGWCTRFPIISIEDPLAEDDWDAWRALSVELGQHLQVLGDDLFATNLDRLRGGIADRVANAVLVKPNQTGTVSRAQAVLDAARRAGYGTVLSARSGDTEDHWLADLAVGWRAGQIKVGSLTRSERTSKWNRLLEIEADAGERVAFAGPAALGSNSRAATKRKPCPKEAVHE